MEAISPELVLVAPHAEAAQARALLPLPPSWTVDIQRIRPLGPGARREVPRPLFIAAVVSNVIAIALSLVVGPKAAHSSGRAAPAPSVAAAPSFMERDLAALQLVAEPRIESPGFFRFRATPR